MDYQFKELLVRLKEQGYYVNEINEELFEIYADNEVVSIAASIEEAYMKLGEFVEADFDNE